MKIMCLTSGGLYSVIMTKLCCKKYGDENVIPVYLNYGAKISKQEIRSFKYFFPKGKIIDIPLNKILKNHWSMQGSSNEKFPHQDRAFVNEYIPARNIIFLSILLPFCELNDIQCLAVGCQADDQMPDNNPTFYKSFSELVKQGTFMKKFKIITPIFNKSKAELTKLGIKMNIELEKTFSCYDDKYGNYVHCGVCHQCKERKEAFKVANIVDPTKYHK